MSNAVRYQVFVSSTFTDLKEERSEVIQAIWELDCIPTGMEAFLATNESQWEVIKKVIDECDYYVLIIGGRYGSITKEGLSYTEKEYNYAKSISIPVLCFVHGDPENIIVSKTDDNQASRTRLESFRKRVMADHPIRKWTNAYELGGLASRSLSRAIKVTPRPGWMRNTGVSSLELLEKINSLTTENTDLKLKLGTNKYYTNLEEQFESGDDEVELDGTAIVIDNDDKFAKRISKTWSAVASWDDIFRYIGPLLLHEATETQIKEMLSRYIGWSKDIDKEKFGLSSRFISAETFASVIVQFRALGFISKGTRKRPVTDKENYWSITERGEQYLVTLLAKRKNNTKNSDQFDADDIPF